MKKNFFIKRIACFVLLSVCGIVGAHAQSSLKGVPVNKVNPIPPIIIPFSLDEPLSFEVYQTTEELLLSANMIVNNVRVVVENNGNVVIDEAFALMAEETTPIDISSLTSGVYYIRIYCDDEEWIGWFNI